MLKRGDPGYEEELRATQLASDQLELKYNLRVYIRPLVNQIFKRVIDNAIRDAALSVAQKAQKEADERKQLELGPFFERLERTRHSHLVASRQTLVAIPENQPRPRLRNLKRSLLRTLGIL